MPAASGVQLGKRCHAGRELDDLEGRRIVSDKRVFEHSYPHGFQVSCARQNHPACSRHAASRRDEQARRVVLLEPAYMLVHQAIDLGQRLPVGEQDDEHAGQD